MHRKNQQLNLDNEGFNAHGATKEVDSQKTKLVRINRKANSCLSNFATAKRLAQMLFEKELAERDPHAVLKRNIRNSVFQPLDCVTYCNTILELNNKNRQFLIKNESSISNDLSQILYKSEQACINLTNEIYKTKRLISYINVSQFGGFFKTPDGKTAEAIELEQAPAEIVLTPRFE